MWSPVLVLRLYLADRRGLRWSEHRRCSEATDRRLKKRFRKGTLLDEWDKRRVSGWETGGRDIAGASVQQEVLRLIEGHEFIIGGRRGNWDWSPVPFQSRGVFVFAGAFCGLDEILDKQGAHGIGFGSPHEGSKGQRYLLDALQEFGLIPEFVNRLTGVLMIPAPTIEQLMSIATRNVIPVFNNVLASCKAQIQVDENAIRLMAESALESRTFARGIKSIISRLVEDLVFEEVQGVVHLGVAEVRQAIEAAGLVFCNRRGFTVA